MEVDCYNYNYIHAAQAQDDIYYNPSSVSPPGSDDHNQTGYRSGYMDPSVPIWTHPIPHAYQPAMNWTQYTDINQQGLKMPSMSAH